MTFIFITSDDQLFRPKYWIIFKFLCFLSSSNQQQNFSQKLVYRSLLSPQSKHGLCVLFCYKLHLICIEKIYTKKSVGLALTPTGVHSRSTTVGVSLEPLQSQDIFAFTLHEGKFVIRAIITKLASPISYPKR